MILTKTFSEPPFCEKEILRYAGCKSPSPDISALLHSCLEEVRPKLSYKVCYRELPVTVTEDVCDFEVFAFTSKNLAQNLKEAKSVILFAATVGTQIDRLISKYGRISPAKGLMLQAIGAERIEALCDAFCDDLKKERPMGQCPRFSPGYGDLPITAQKEIFALLDCPKHIGLSLTDSFLMSPSKSVTAFVGLTDAKTNEK